MFEVRGGTATAQRLVTVVIGNMRCGLPLAEVVEVLPAARLEPLPGAPAAVMGVLDVRGEVLAVLDGRVCLGLDSAPLRAADRFVVVEVDDRRQAIRVDAAEGLVDVDGDAITAAASLAPAALSSAGVARLAAGLLVVHDPARFLSPRDAVQLQQALSDHVFGGRA